MPMATLFMKNMATLMLLSKLLKISVEKLIKWFKDYQIKGNTDKCHFDIKYQIQTGNSLIKESLCEKLL